MKVKDLIKLLNEMPQDLDIEIPVPEDGCIPSYTSNMEVHYDKGFKDIRSALVYIRALDEDDDDESEE